MSTPEPQERGNKMHRNQANIRRIRTLGKEADRVLRQAQQSHQDFVGEYGNLEQDIQHLRQAGVLSDAGILRQADYQTSTSGVLNRVFGRGVWPQLNTHAQTWDLLPKSQRSRTSTLGWRAKTAFADSGKGGQSEGTVPTAVVGSYTEVSPTPKETTTQMRVSGLHQDMYEIDDAYGSLQELQNEISVEHAKQIERALNEDIDTTAGNNFESVDRVPASSANQSDVGWTAGDEDIFGIDRSGNTWANGTQDAAASARAISTDLVDGLFQDVISKGGQPTVWHTGYDTWKALSHLYDARGRMDIGVQAQQSAGTFEDAEAAEGQAVSTFLGRLHGRLIIASDQVQSPSNEISRLNLFDTSNPEGADKPRMGFDVIRPTQVYLAGERSQGAPQNLGSGFLGDSVLVVTRGELGCRFFRGQGQLRDITNT